MLAQLRGVCWVNRKSAILAAVLGVSSPVLGHAAESSALAFIDLRYTPGGIEVAGKALAVSDIQLTGEMTISRKGAGGSVSTRQGSELTMAAGESAEIARVNVSYQAGDQIEVRVVLSQDGAVVAESTLTANGR